MKFTTLCNGVNLGSGATYKPGDHLDWAKKNCRPLIDTGAAVEGHVSISEKAAQLCRDHEIDPHDIKGTGKGGRVVTSDVEAAVEPAEEPVEAEEG